MAETVGTLMWYKENENICFSLCVCFFFLSFFFKYSCKECRNTFLGWESSHEKTSVRVRLRAILHNDSPELFETVKGRGDRRSEELFPTAANWGHLATKCHVCFWIGSWPRKEKYVGMMFGKIWMGFMDCMIGPCHCWFANLKGCMVMM